MNRPVVAAVAALAVHALIGWGMVEVEAPAREVVVEEPVDIELVAPAKPEAELEPEAAPPAPPPQRAPEPPPQAARATAEPPPERERAPEPPPPPASPAAPPAAGATGDPAPGWAETPPTGDAYQLGDVPVGQARAPAGHGRGGTGGGGGGTGGGGHADTAAPQTAAPAPVSVAEIKTMPKPIGDTDFVEAHSDYPAEARQLGIEGQVKVRLVVDAEGHVAKRSLVTRLGHGLDELALRLAARLRFDPALDTADKPVAATVVWTFTFTLPH